VAKLATKSEILEDAGYVYNFERLAYVNRQAKKVISIEFVEDNSEEEIKKRISEPNPSGKWLFIFNSEPSESVKRELESVLG
jgi:hypothetical protein